MIDSASHLLTLQSEWSSVSFHQMGPESRKHPLLLPSHVGKLLTCPHGWHSLGVGACIPILSTRGHATPPRSGKAKSDQLVHLSFASRPPPTQQYQQKPHQ